MSDHLPLEESCASRSRDLILTDFARPISVGAIAEELRFYDQSHFTAQFRDVMGTTPASYRSRVRRTLRASYLKAEQDRA